MSKSNYKVGDLVKLKNTISVPESLRGSVAVVSEIVDGPETDYHRCFDKDAPLYVLYINEQCKGLYWEEAEFELARNDL